MNCFICCGFKYLHSFHSWVCFRLIIANSCISDKTSCTRTSLNSSAMADLSSSVKFFNSISFFKKSFYTPQPQDKEIKYDYPLSCYKWLIIIIYNCLPICQHAMRCTLFRWQKYLFQKWRKITNYIIKDRIYAFIELSNFCTCIWFQRLLDD